MTSCWALLRSPAEHLVLGHRRDVVVHEAEQPEPVANISAKDSSGARAITPLPPVVSRRRFRIGNTHRSPLSPCYLTNLHIMSDTQGHSTAIHQQQHPVQPTSIVRPSTLDPINSPRDPHQPLQNKFTRKPGGRPSTYTGRKKSAIRRWSDTASHTGRAPVFWARQCLEIVWIKNGPISIGVGDGPSDGVSNWACRPHRTPQRLSDIHTRRQSAASELGTSGRAALLPAHGSGQGLVRPPPAPQARALCLLAKQTQPRTKQKASAENI